MAQAQGYFTRVRFKPQRSIRKRRDRRSQEPVEESGLIQFNLACYEAQMGSIHRAKVHLRRATKADPKFSLMAMDDPDLEPLWATLAKS